MPPQGISARVRARLARCMTDETLAVFGLGDSARALTLTANGAALRAAAREGVDVEAQQHRPVWLAGR